MRYLLDTNVVSELRKGARCDPSVSEWAARFLYPGAAAISVITVGEIRKGIELIRRRDAVQAATLEAWLSRLCVDFRDRILDVSIGVAEEWGKLNAARPVPAIDSLLAATANVYHLILVTRNTRDLVGIARQTLNPFENGA
ncbi:MAG: type II toxin-antitoxin system VapC family toxin [Planctomycetales bacterium]|nr:type II toxin-antitoxin system VapC family toxin [Planctomycetales bacterium]